MQTPNTTIVLHKKKYRGVALLMALIITLVLSIVLFKSFEDSRLEIKLLSNDESKFQVYTTAISLIKVFLISVKEAGANDVYNTLLPFSAVPDFPLELSSILDGVTVTNPKIWSMDHYIYIEREYDKDHHYEILAKVFSKYLTSEETNFEKSLIGAIQDFRDENRSVSSGKINGTESYPLATAPFETKNRPFDTLSELKPLFAFHKITLIDDQWEQLPIRVYSIPHDSKKHDKFYKGMVFKDTEAAKNPCHIDKMNINMLPKSPYTATELSTVITDFIGLNAIRENEKDCTAKELKKLEENIIESLVNKFINEGEEQQENNFTNLSEWKIAGLTKNTKKFKETFFKTRSNIIGISSDFFVNDVKAHFVAHAFLKYNNSTSVKPEKITVLYYKLYV